MNANEGIATLASKISGEDVSPNDDVNMSQSSNDVIPTAIKISAHMDLTKKLYPKSTFSLELKNSILYFLSGEFLL